MRLLRWWLSWVPHGLPRTGKPEGFDMGAELPADFVRCLLRSAWCQSVPQFQGLGDSEFLQKAMCPRSAGLFHRNFATCFGYEGAEWSHRRGCYGGSGGASKDAIVSEPEPFPLTSPHEPAAFDPAHSLRFMPSMQVATETTSV